MCAFVCSCTHNGYYITIMCILYFTEPGCHVILCAGPAPHVYISRGFRNKLTIACFVLLCLMKKKKKKKKTERIWTKTDRDETKRVSVLTVQCRVTGSALTASTTTTCQSNTMLFWWTQNVAPLPDSGYGCFENRRPA